MGEFIRQHQDLKVYKVAFAAAMTIFEVTKTFPKEEKYSLTDQIRRSSRSVCANIAEAWRKRRYEAAFVSKLSDSEAEAAETQTWLEFAHHCHYLSPEASADLIQTYDQILAMIVTLIRNASHWSTPATKSTKKP
ncbi:four helix bundle protein [Leptolyngbya sp. PCC 6406]|uniref:four helix bundle protein n=1 Tax=Leptolyngbya sp. PCC 6406 TaxID=1173264 RepID=UPI0002AC8E30|nr:four helix bundle protein [Leptolyngbya sp. PCC 6406]